ncbi:MAG: tetratricopeptide repeat protein, partial [Pyrinomonadaceae bacterium]
IKKIQPSPFLPISSSPHLNSIAVLPFSNMSADAENEYFCDGLAEELLNALAKIEDLKVAARTSAFSFKNKNVEVGEIGKTLNVNTVLEGSVRKSGNRLRITVQLVNAADGYHLWSERYDREMKDIFDVQDKITLAIVDALKVKLLGEEKAALLNRYTDNAEAYELYLKGLYHNNKHTAEGWLKGIEFFEQAIQIEPDYAPAYAGIGICCTTLYIFGVLSPGEIVLKWKAAISRALEIDDHLAEAHLSSATLNFYHEWNWAEAEREYLRAIELNPNLPRAFRGYAHYLGLMRRHDESITYVKRAREFDPLSVIMNNSVGLRLHHARRSDEAIEAYRKALELDKNSATAHRGLGDAFAAKRMFREAFAEYREAIRSRGGNNPNIEALLGAAYARGGERGKAEEILQKLQAQGNKPNPQELAVLYDALGMTEEVFAQLEKSYAERDLDLPYIGIDPNYDNLRSDPRFQDLLRRMGLPQ